MLIALAVLWQQDAAVRSEADRRRLRHQLLKYRSASPLGLELALAAIDEAIEAGELAGLGELCGFVREHPASTAPQQLHAGWILVHLAEFNGDERR